MLTGCAGHKQTGAGAVSGYRESAPVEVVRVLDKEFVRDPAAPNAATPLIESPVALAVAANGGMVIADRRSGRILKTDARGNLRGSVAYFDPRGLSATRAPRFVRTDYIGNVYVSDASNARISIYDSRLRPVSSLSPPYAALELPEGSISGLAFGSYGEFYMADLLNGRIFRFDASGRFLAQFPGDEETLPPLNRPMGLACANLDGAVYVCESGNAQIVVFDNLGAQVRTFGGSELKDPVAIALDTQGRCFVADAAFDAVVVFTREGRFLGRLDAGRIGFADFNAPTDVTISDESLYIADPSHGRILQIRFGADTPAP
jgi:DNA-binding beta-propeller fold protein YncE